MKKTKKANCGLRARWPQLEERVHRWMLEHCAAGRGLSTVRLCLHALVVAKEMNINDFAGFLVLPLLATQPPLYQSTDNDVSETASRLPSQGQQFLWVHWKAGNWTQVSPDHIINMDKVLLTFDIPMGRSVTEKGQRSVNIVTTGNVKSHFTVVLACCGDGSKLPPMVIFKPKTMPQLWQCDWSIKANVIPQSSHIYYRSYPASIRVTHITQNVKEIFYDKIIKYKKENVLK